MENIMNTYESSTEETTRAKIGNSHGTMPTSLLQRQSRHAMVSQAEEPIKVTRDVGR